MGLFHVSEAEARTFAELGIALTQRIGLAGRVRVHGLEFSGARISTLTHDSRQVEPGSLFCCVPGTKTDGHRFAQKAVDDGAVALLVNRVVTTSPEVPQFIVDDVRALLGPVAAEVFGNPASDLVMVGVTGTNGKTSTAHLLADMLIAGGHNTAVIGTLTQTRTTPEATDVQERLAELLAEGVTHVVMEVSSHALVLSRVDGIKFQIAIFTNLTQDHLDFHGTMEAYFRAKAELFTPRFAEQAVVNFDDPYGRLLRDASQIPTDTYRLADVSDLEIGVPNRFIWHGLPVVLPLGGLFSVFNALAAATAALQLGVTPEAIVKGLAVAHVPGRFETVDAGQEATVIVDYAHTPDGLQRVLESARVMVSARRATSFPASRLLVLFGCGGDRDREKRPLMGDIAVRLSDLAVLTSDNPRTEDPDRILTDILAGIKDREHLVVEPDRRSAIRTVLLASAPGDVVILAGKGHEQGQDIGGLITPFDDRTVTIEEMTDLKMIRGTS
jgi:UDP-N-acetylmuramoyl-L-alanyl-D-glutamate--2,6-diaminopimelate ligase